MSNWWDEQWKEGKEWTPIFMPAKSGEGAHDDMFFASVLAQKAFMDRMPWWKKLWLRIKSVWRRIAH